jgi:hypothetical protein
MAIPAAVYRPRNPQATDYDRCVEDHLGNSIKVYEERFERAYGFIGYFRSPCCATGIKPRPAATWCDIISLTYKASFRIAATVTKQVLIRKNQTLSETLPTLRQKKMAEFRTKIC